MGRKSILILAGLLCSLARPMDSAQATTFLRFESTVLGDGWFQYHMSVKNDPFFSAAYVSGFAVSFTNQIDHSESSDWVSTNWSNGWASWSGESFPATRPYEITFLARSSETSFRTAFQPTNGLGALVLTMLWPLEYRPAGPVATANIVGYAFMPCLAPCNVSEADGSPTNLVYDLKLLPDIDITRLIQTNSEIHGVEFSWQSASTFLLQGTANFTDWTNIAYVFSSPSNTVWTTSEPLNGYGQCFRLALVTSDLTTNLPPLRSALLKRSANVTTTMANPLPRVASCAPRADKVRVNIEGNKNQACIVEAVDSSRHVILEKRLRLRGTTGAVDFNACKLPNPVFFRVSAR